MRRQITLIIFVISLIISGCSQAPSESTINTATAQTKAAQPTSTPTNTPSPTNTPYPTDTPFPTETQTLLLTHTVSLVQETSCNPDVHLVDIVPANGKGVFVLVKCFESNPNRIQSLMIIVPEGTPSTMIDEAMLYVYLVTMKGGWDVNDVDVVFQHETSDCNENLVTSRDVSGICMPVENGDKILSFFETP